MAGLLYNDWLEELEQSAKEKLPKEVYDFVSGGADCETALRDNISDYDNIALIPRVLRDVSTVDTTISLDGCKLDSPIIVAPTAPHKLLHKAAETEMLKGVKRTNCLMTVSCMSSTSIESLADNEYENLWLQVHFFSDKSITEKLIKLAEYKRFKGIVITVDMPVLGNRTRDLRNKFKIPDDCISKTLADFGFLENIKTFSLSSHMNSAFDAELNWEKVNWLQEQTKLPIYLKGLLHPKDASIAVKKGINGIIVSNHGARQLGDAISTIEALPAIVDVVAEEIPVLVDGGIRSGSCILKALALGASAVQVGRPVLWGLAVGGSYGVSGVLSKLNAELKHAMKLCGLRNLDEIRQEGKSILSYRKR